MPTCKNRTLSTIVAGEQDLEFYANDDSDLSFEFFNDDGSNMDLTGWSFEMMVKINKTDPDASAKADWSTTGGQLTVTGNTVALATKVNIKGGNYFYDLQGTLAGKVTTWLYGQFIVFQDVTANSGEN